MSWSTGGSTGYLNALTVQKYMYLAYKYLFELVRSVSPPFSGLRIIFFVYCEQRRRLLGLFKDLLAILMLSVASKDMFLA